MTSSHRLRAAGPGGFRALALLVAAGALLGGCGGEPPPAADVTTVSSGLNLSVPGRGSGLLWRTSNGELHLWDMASSTSYQDFLLGAPSSIWQTVGTGDFNNDGAGDILWIDGQDRALSEWDLNDTQVSVMTPATSNAPIMVGGGPPLVGDLDGDGISDVIWRGIARFSQPYPLPPIIKNTALTWMMTAGSTVPRSTSTVSSSTDIVQAVGNFDGDSLHRADLLHRTNNVNMSVTLGGGGSITLPTVSVDWVVKGVGDFNGDQTSDILWYNNNSGDVSIWQMQGGRLAANPVPGGAAPSTGWTIQGVGDVDHDGISDIIWRHSSGWVSIWMMSGPGTVREFGGWISVPTTTTFAGVIELGPPPVPTNVSIANETFKNGHAMINVTFNAVRGADQVEVWENVGGGLIYSQRVPYYPLAGTVRTAAIDTTMLRGGTGACFQLRAWEQGRVSGFASSICASGLPQPIPSLDWEVQDQFGRDDDGDGAIDTRPSQQVLTAVRTQRFPITLDACGSYDPAGGTITGYTWRIQLPTGPATVAGSLCKTSDVTAFPQGQFAASLTIMTADGRSATTTGTIYVRNYLIVSMGDSYASGEGEPVVDAVWQNVTLTAPAYWGPRYDGYCHRSANSGPARAALALERSDPHSSVTFLSTACSGGVIANIIDTPQATDSGTLPLAQFQDVQTQLCTNVQPTGFPASCTPSQMPPIDALLVSIGGNDVHFSDIIMTCAEEPNPAAPFSCSNDAWFLRTEQAALAALPGKLGNLVTKLAGLNAPRVYITEYPDSIHQDAGTVCDEVVLENAIGGVSDATIGHDDLVWAAGFIHQVDVAILTAAGAAPGWTYVGGLETAFATHGYCTADHWTNHYAESLNKQADIKGTMHPNIEGANAYAAQILGALSASGIGSPGASSFIPPGKVLWRPPL